MQIHKWKKTPEIQRKRENALKIVLAEWKEEKEMYNQKGHCKGTEFAIQAL